MAAKPTYHTLDENELLIVSSKEDAKQQLEVLGIQKGMVLLVYANTSRLGHLIGGTQIIIEALMELAGYEGTIIMPTFTPQLLDPSCQKRRVNQMYWNKVRSSALAFNRKLTPPVDDEALIHQFLKNEGVIRSYHPLYSFAAWGKYAKIICDKHPLHFGLSKDSPLGKMVEFNGYVVMLGCDYEDCSFFQLARYNNEHVPIRILRAPIENNHKVLWKDMLDLDYNTTYFSQVGAIMEERSIVKTSYIGNGRCRLFSAREAALLATAYFNIHNE